VKIFAFKRFVNISKAKILNNLSLFMKKDPSPADRLMKRQRRRNIFWPWCALDTIVIHVTRIPALESFLTATNSHFE